MGNIKAEGTKIRFDGHELTCIISDWSIEKTREVDKINPVNCPGTRKVIGAKEIGDITFAVIKGDDANAAAEQAIRDAFENGTLLAFEIEDDDKPSGGTNGTKVSFNCYVIKDVVKYAANKDLEFEFTITINGDYTKTAAA